MARNNIHIHMGSMHLYDIGIYIYRYISSLDIDIHTNIHMSYVCICFTGEVGMSGVGVCNCLRKRNIILQPDPKDWP